MIDDKRQVLYPATAYRPTAVAVLMEDSNILDPKTNTVETPNYSVDSKVYKENISKPVKNPFGSAEVSHAVVLELLEGGGIKKHTVGNSDNTSGDGLIGQTFPLDNMQGSFVATSRFLALNIGSFKDMKVAGVYLELNNKAHAWANGIIGSSPVNLIKYTCGINFEEPYLRLTTEDVRLGLKGNFIRTFDMIAEVNADTHKTILQKTDEVKKLTEKLEGDVIHFTDKDQWVVFTFGIPITHLGSQSCIYSLSYFVDGSIDPNSIDTDYWYGDKEVSCYPDLSRHLVKPFWVGRNEFCTMVGYTSSVLELAPFHNFFWKFVQDRNHGKIFIPALENGWQGFRTTAVAMGLTDLQAASIYLAYYTGVPTNVFQACAGVMSGDTIDVFCKYAKRCHMFTFEWIDFNDVDPNPGTGGFSLDYPYDSDFLDMLNIEESGFSLQQMPTFLCSAFKPHGWRFVEYPNAYNCIKPEEDNPPQKPMYTGYALRAIKNVTNMGPYLMTEIVIHEIGHAVDAYGQNTYLKNFSDMQEWLDLCGWDPSAPYDTSQAVIEKQGYNITLADGGEAPVSGYGCTNRKDDFAETYRMYIINPGFLRDFYPRRYAFMEKYIKTLKPVKEAETCAIRDFCNKRKPWVCR